MKIDHKRISPNSTNPRRHKISKITIHHVAGNLTVETVGNIFAPKSRRASSNYGVDGRGRVGMYVEEKNRAWTSGDFDNDHRAVTIEVSNSGGAPTWPVNDTALEKTIELCVDICKRNGMKELVYTGDKTGSLTRHDFFQNTVCPGPYLGAKFPYIAEEVTRRLKGSELGNPIGQGIILVDRLNVRSGPSTSAPIVGVMQKGQVFDVYSDTGREPYIWLQVGKDRFVSNAKGNYVDEYIDRKEIDEMLDVAIIINSFVDYPMAEAVAQKERCPIYPPGSIVKANKLIVVGGQAPDGFRGEIVVLSGKTRFETARNVERYLR